MGKQAMGQSSLHIPVCYGQAGHGSVSQSPSLLRCVRRRLKLNEFGATDVGRITKQLNITAIIQSWRLSIFVHIARTYAKVILASPPPYNWKRPPGRPRITWLNTVQRDLRAYKLRSIAEARVSNSSLRAYKLRSIAEARVLNSSLRAYKLRSIAEARVSNSSLRPH